MTFKPPEAARASVSWPRRGGWLAFVFVLVSVASTLGCDRVDYDPPTLIKGFRVLAVRVDPPYIGMQPSVTSSLVVKVTPGQQLCYAWALCPFAWENDGNFECLDPRIQVDLGNDPQVSMSLVSLATALEALPDVLADRGFNRPQDVQATAEGRDGGGEPPPQADSGLSVRLLFQISEARVWGGTCPRDTSTMLGAPCPSRDGCLQGHKELSVALPGDNGLPGKGAHNNPTLTGLELEDVLWPASVTPVVPPAGTEAQDGLGEQETPGQLNLLPVWTDDSVELVAKSVDPGVPDRLERLRISFFSDAGSFRYRRTGDQAADNLFRPAAAAASGQVNLWVVVRDDRGGVDWLTRRLEVSTGADLAHPLCGPTPDLPGCEGEAP